MIICVIIFFLDVMISFVFGYEGFKGFWLGYWFFFCIVFLGMFIRFLIYFEFSMKLLVLGIFNSGFKKFIGKYDKEVMGVRR